MPDPESRAPAPSPLPIPDPSEVRRIAAVRDPVIRNLQITECYHRLSAAFRRYTGPVSNWCTFATWASRQAGATIRGEDLWRRLRERAGEGFSFWHPFESVWRMLLRRGLFHPETTLGKLVRETHTPFDVFERASDAVARGNLKVFEEIAAEFARFLEAFPEGAGPDPQALEAFLGGLRPGEPPEGQALLRQAFARYDTHRLESSPAARAQSVFLANLEIGLHEQTRLQPEIQESLEAAPTAAEDLGRRLLPILRNAPRMWRIFSWRPLLAVIVFFAGRFRSFARGFTRRAVTESLMTLQIPPSRVLRLGRPLDAPPAPGLAELDNAELTQLLERFESAAEGQVTDWADLRQRLWYIIRLFRAFHEDPALHEPPFDAAQAAQIRAGRLPVGDL